MVLLEKMVLLFIVVQELLKQMLEITEIPMLTPQMAIFIKKKQEFGS